MLICVTIYLKRGASMDIIITLYNALGQLIDDYYKCDDLTVKEKIQCEIILLIDVILNCD